MRKYERQKKQLEEELSNINITALDRESKQFQLQKLQDQIDQFNISQQQLLQT